MRPRPVTILAVVICLAGVAVLVRTLQSGADDRQRHVEQPVLVIEGLPRYDDIRLLSTPNDTSLSKQIMSLRTSIHARAIENDLAPQASAALADAASEHFRVLVSGDYDAWAAIVDRIGSNPRGVFANNGLPFETEADRLAFKKSWDNATKSMRFARFDPERVMLRWSRCDGTSIEHEPPPQALPTSFDGGFQPVVDKKYKNADLVEVIVPVQLTMPDASETKPLFFAAMTFALPKDSELALPYTMTLYSVKTVGGSIVLPAF